MKHYRPLPLGHQMALTLVRAVHKLDNPACPVAGQNRPSKFCPGPSSGNILSLSHCPFVPRQRKYIRPFIPRKKKILFRWKAYAKLQNWIWSCLAWTLDNNSLRAKLCRSIETDKSWRISASAVGQRKCRPHILINNIAGWYCILCFQPGQTGLFYGGQQWKIAQWAW